MLTQEPLFKDRHLYEEAILHRVCTKCIDFGTDGRCHYGGPRGCPIFRYLPELVKIAEQIRDYRIQPYIDAVRKEVCMKCESGLQKESCPLRDTLDCGLDRYLPLVLEALEEVKREEEMDLWRQL